MKHSKKLQFFQDALKEILLKENDPFVIKQKLLNHSASIFFKDFVEQMDLKMLAAAAEMLKKWN